MVVADIVATYYYQFNKTHLKHALKLEGIVSEIVKKYLNLQCRGSIVHSWL